MVPTITTTPLLQIKGKLDGIDLIHIAAAEKKIIEQRKMVDERISQVFGSTNKSTFVKHVTKVESIPIELKEPERNKVGEPSSKSEFKPVVLKPKSSSFKFTEKHPMEFIFSPPRPDEEKLLADDIKSYKNTQNVVRRARMAKIYRHGKLICVIEGHPGFAIAKREENLRLNNETRESEAVAKALQEDENSKTLTSNEEEKIEEEIEEMVSMGGMAEKSEAGERKEWQKGHRKKRKARREGNDDEETEEKSTKTQPQLPIPEPIILDPNFNIHGEPIIPKEEPIDWDNIKLPTFLTSPQPPKKKLKQPKKSLPPKSSAKF
ncbi:MAG: hypothetical protein DI617_09450, partial [Streptococcus pyogenes]